MRNFRFFEGRAADWLQCRLEPCRGFPRHAVVIHGVGTIGANLHFEDPVRAFTGDAFDRNPNRSEVLGQTAIAARNINEVANPLGRKFHLSILSGREMLRPFEPTALWVSANSPQSHTGYPNCSRNLTSP